MAGIGLLVRDVGSRLPLLRLKPLNFQASPAIASVTCMVGPRAKSTPPARLGGVNK
jgi:hypothetical protein